ncbi:MAG: alpha/beta fold hydrolase [Candidatus Heimdallarchaeaceae archaeon]
MNEQFLTVSEKPLIKLRHVFLPSKNEKSTNPTILMIPGWLDNIDQRKPLVETFRKIADVIMFEPRGFGKSSSPKKRGLYTVNNLTKDLFAIIKHYNLENENFFLWGSCLGAQIAYQYCIENLGPKPKAIIAASPDSKNRTYWWFKLLKYAPYPILWLIYKVIVFFFKFYLKMKNPEEVKNLDYSAKKFEKLGLYVQLRLLIEAVDGFDIRGREHEIGVPQLVLYAENDWFTRPTNSEKLSTFHPKSRKIVFDDVHRFVVGNEERIVEETEKYIQTL